MEMLCVDSDVRSGFLNISYVNITPEHVKNC